MQIINPFSKEIIKVETNFCGRKLGLEVNRLAFRSQAAVTLTYGQTVLLATVNVGEINPQTDYFPMSVDYEERFYAAGKISGSRYIKREGRPSDDAVLTGRLIDRPLRPLFPKGYRYPVQIVVTVLSLDSQMRADFLGITAASSALSLTGVPFNGPVAASKVGYVDNQFIICPTKEELKESALEVLVASKNSGVMMVEAKAGEVDEEIIAQALEAAHQENQILVNLQKDLIAQVAPKPQEYELVLPTNTIEEFTKNYLSDKLSDILSGDYAQRLEKLKNYKQAFGQHLQEVFTAEELAEDKVLYETSWEMVIDKAIRQKIIDEERRLDGRRLDEVRPLSSQVGLLPRTHGSALFTRGATQALNIVTLASTSFSQLIDTMERDEEKHYFHHYSAPGYTVGEVQRMGGVGRREIGHSYLAEKALVPVLPSLEDFPYTIRSVSEIMSQQGSTSMAATCASCLALMDAGVPIKAPVSGVAMGLILKTADQPLFLTDIADAEDFAGDMDFKVAGTTKGITALQMDMKVAGLSVQILREALLAGRPGRETILKHMLSVLERPREQLSPFAPRMKSLKIPANKIKDLIGKGGETIHALTAATGAQIDIKDDGQVFVFCEDVKGLEDALVQIRELTEDPQVGHTYYDKTVVKILDFGAFVNISGGHDGLVHISEMSQQRLKHPSEMLKEGDKVDVKLIAIDDQGRYNLSMKKALNKK